MILSIVIPVYNVEKYVERCLLSCECQNLPKDSYEIIIVNDGSEDNSLKIVEKLSLRFNNIRIYSQKNSGLSIARNEGVRKACGEFIMFVDSDDWIAENCLKRISELCQKNKLDMLSFCAADVVNGVAHRRFSYRNETIYEGKKRMITGKISVCAPFAIYRREFLIANKLFFYPSVFHEDNEFKPRAFYYALKVMDIDDLVYFVFQNPNSITRSVNPKKAFDRLIVCNSLHSFCAHVEKQYRNGFFHIISECLNSALYQITSLNEKQKKELNEKLYESKFIFSDLIESDTFKYKIEGFLFSMFPRHTIKIFELIQVFNLKYWKNFFNRFV